jgi:hypothetical protein
MRLTAYKRYTDFALMSPGLNVAFESKAEVRVFNIDVRFTPESGHSAARE